MIAGIPTLGIRFDIGRVDEGSYGVACWKALWRAIPPGEIASSQLFEGDTAASMDGEENVYCIAIQSFEPAVAARIRAAIADNTALRRICAVPPVVEGAACLGEPLLAVGRVDFAGKLCGNSWNAQEALSAISKEARGGAHRQLLSTDVGLIPCGQKGAHMIDTQIIERHLWATIVFKVMPTTDTTRGDGRARLKNIQERLERECKQYVTLSYAEMLKQPTRDIYEGSSAELLDDIIAKARRINQESTKPKEETSGKKAWWRFW